MSLKTLRDLLEYALVRVLLTAALGLGPVRALRLARAFGGLLWRFDVKHRERALANLRARMPELLPAEREALVRSSFASFAQTVVESLYSPRLVGRRVPPTIELDADPEALEALRAGRGAILFTAHIGNWELAGSLMCLWGWPLVSVARPLRNPFLDRYLVAGRERWGQRIVPKRGALRELSKAIRKGGLLAMLVDQNAGRHGVFADFFGRPTSTTGAPATIALKYDVPLIPGWQRRLPGVGRHRVVLEKPLARPDTGSREGDVLALTTAMNARVEAWVREVPGQWLWAHRRWKARPPEEQGKGG